MRSELIKFSDMPLWCEALIRLIYEKLPNDIGDAWLKELAPFVSKELNFERIKRPILVFICELSKSYLDPAENAETIAKISRVINLLNTEGSSAADFEAAAEDAGATSDLMENERVHSALRIAAFSALAAWAREIASCENIADATNPVKTLIEIKRSSYAYLAVEMAIALIASTVEISCVNAISQEVLKLIKELK